jgi:hypothetical protein
MKRGSTTAWLLEPWTYVRIEWMQRIEQKSSAVDPTRLQVNDRELNGNTTTTSGVFIELMNDNNKVPVKALKIERTK